MTTDHERRTPLAAPIRVSPAAAAVIDRIRTERGHNLAVLISDGCCDGTAPMLVDASFVIPDNDVWLGDVAQAAVYVSPWAASRYEGCELDFNLEEDTLGGMLSLEAAYRVRLTVTVQKSKSGGPVNGPCSMSPSAPPS